MLVTGLQRQGLWGMVRLCLMTGMLMWACAVPEPPHPQQPPPDVSRPLAALEACIIRTQGAVKAATDAGSSAGPLAPINSSIADAQDAVDESKKLSQQGQQLAAAERLTQALAACDQLDAMLVKVQQDTAERKLRAQLASEADSRMVSTMTCIDGVQQALRRASAAGARGAEITAAKSALDRAATGLQQARDMLAHNDPRRAVGHLEAAQAECQMARDASDNIIAQTKSAASPARPRRGR